MLVIVFPEWQLAIPGESGYAANRTGELTEACHQVKIFCITSV
jgi:hypothetical protein